MASTPAATASDSYQGLEETLARVLVNECYQSDTNPRTVFEIEDLRVSVREKGVIEPLVLREKPKAGRKFEIVDGERRWRSARAEGVETVAAVIRNYTDAQVVEVQLISTLQRADLTPLERAETYRRLMGGTPTKAAAETLALRLQLKREDVWDTALLTQLVPEAQTLLRELRITVEHAILLSKQPAKVQKNTIDPHGGALWEGTEALNFDEDAPENAGRKRGRYDDVKPIAVGELRAHFRDETRFDPAHAAKAQPFLFEVTAQAIEAAEAQPGRKKKTAWITTDHRVSDFDKDPEERTYGRESWKRADGKEKSKTCEHSVLGIFAAGRGQGTTLQVCVNRDKCETHWGAVVKSKKKNATLRASGQTAKALANEARQRAKDQAEAERRQREAAIWSTVEPLLFEEALQQAKKIKTLTAKQAKVIEDADLYYNLQNLLHEQLGKTWFKTPVTAWLVIVIAGGNSGSFDEFMTDVVKPLGLEVKRFEAIRDKHMPKDEPAEKPGAKKKAKKS